MQEGPGVRGTRTLVVRPLKKTYFLSLENIHIYATNIPRRVGQMGIEIFSINFGKV